MTLPALHPRLLLMGFYGRRNFGDDLMCRSVAATLSANNRRVSIAADSARAFADLAMDGIAVVPRSPSAIVQAVLGSDILVQAGGTIFHDSYRGRAYWRYLINLVLWLTLFAIARVLGKRILVVGAGIGPLRTLPARRLAKAALSMAAFITVRDRPSYETAATLRLRLGVAEGADLAFLTSAPPLGRTQAIIGVSACDLSRFETTMDPRSFWKGLAEALSTYCRDRQLKVRLFALYADGSERDDRRTIQQLERWIDGDAQLDSHFYSENTNDTLLKIAECSAFIATRYHAAVGALIARRPVAVIPYNRKVADLAAQAAIPPSRIIATNEQRNEAAWHALFDDLLATPTADEPSDLATRTARAVDQALAAGGLRP